jgi:hypothetical protein
VAGVLLFPFDLRLKNVFSFKYNRTHLTPINLALVSKSVYKSVKDF